MKSVTLVLLFFLIVQSLSKTPKRRIHYGDEVHTKIPYMIGLIRDQGKVSYVDRFFQFFQRNENYYEVVCGATLFKTHWAVTAAHCIDPSSGPIHLAGTGGLYYDRMRQYHTVVHTWVHSGYIPHSGNSIVDYDIGLVKTATDMRDRNTRNVAYMTIEPLTFWGTGPFTMYGWGLTHHKYLYTKLHEMQVNYVTDVDFCNVEEGVRSGRMLCFEPIKPNQIIDYGDSGSPIVHLHPDPYSGNNIVSVVSGAFGNIVVGVNVSYFRHWLDTTTNKFEYYN